MSTFSSFTDHRLRGLAQELFSHYMLPGRELNLHDLTRTVDRHYSNAVSSGQMLRPYMYDLLQIIHNAAIYEDAKNSVFSMSSLDVPGYYAKLVAQNALLPTHTFRDFDKVDLQQFSTPPAYSLMAAYSANLLPHDIFAEPSAGCGGLAIHGAAFAKSCYINEIDPERLHLLRQLPVWNDVREGDAGLIHLRPFAEKPTVVVMNPPFSMDQGRKDPMTAARHIEAALALLQPGGRLVAIVSGGIDRGGDTETGMGMVAPAFRGWWNTLMTQFTVRCNVGINGTIYRKFGTNFRTRLVVIDKVGPQEGGIPPLTQIGGCNFVNEPLDILHDMGFRAQVIKTRLWDLSEATQKIIVEKMMKGRQPNMHLPSREKYGLAPVIETPTVEDEPTIETEETGTQELINLMQHGSTTGPQPTESAAVTPPAHTPAPVPAYTLLKPKTYQIHGFAEKCVTELLYALGIADRIGQGTNEDEWHLYAKVKNPPYMNLTIEQHASTNGFAEVMFTHYFEQNGDLVMDAELVFSVKDGQLRLQETATNNPIQGGELRLSGQHLDREFGNLFAKNLLDQKFGQGMLWFPEEESEPADLVDEETSTPESSPTVVEADLDRLVPEGELPQIVLSGDEESTIDVEEQAITDVFQGYKPFVKVPGAQPHNVTLVESNTMQLVNLPIARHRVHFPKQAIELGRISDAQAENVIYAINCHEQVLRDGATRKAFLIGDGTGVGKGVQAAATFMHYWLKSNRQARAIWVTKEFSLAKDALRDWTFIGGSAGDIFTQDRCKDQKIGRQTGILVTTYTTMSGRGGEKAARGGATRTSVDRLQQIISWLQEGAKAGMPTLIIFDESHLMGNAVSVKGARGTTKASQRAVAGLELQESVPDTAILFLSATSATEVHNLGYAAYRMGLCGEHVPAFPTLEGFISSIKKSGMLGMELVAKDMKSMGVYNARNLSYEGTSFEMLEHKLLPEQLEVYNESCFFWRMAYDYIKAGFEMNGTSGMGKAMALGQFWGAAQRYYNQILISMQTPTAIEHMLKNIEAGHSIVVQLVNTNEAATERAVGEALAAEVNLDDLDITPRDSLMQLIRNNFPVTMYHMTMDDNGNMVSKPVLDADGNPVANPEAIALRDELLLQLQNMRVPQGALDMLLEQMDRAGYPFAEVSGRTKRYLMRPDEKNPGNFTRGVENRSKSLGDAEAAEFMAGKRRGLIFSGAGNTGRSFHSDLRCHNQQRRIHYVLQPGWRADEAIQGMGRTHRTNQANAPHYILVTTDLPGQKRFVTSIARRIEQLGALTKGNRAAASSGLFSEADNLETQWALHAIHTIFRSLWHLNADMLERCGCSFFELADMMGLNNLVDNSADPPQMNTDALPPVTQFLNRVLFLPTDMQIRIFGVFEEVHRDVVEEAKMSGLFDHGVEKIAAAKIVKTMEHLVSVDDETGARTYVVQLECHERNDAIFFEEAQQGKYVADNLLGYSNQNPYGFLKWVKVTQSQKVYGVFKAGVSTSRKGIISEMVRLVGPTTTLREAVDVFNAKKTIELQPNRAAELWENEVKNAPKFNKKYVHLITGANMPVWDKLGNSKVRIYVAETEAGERIIGRLIDDSELNVVLNNLGANSDGVTMTPEQMIYEVMNDGSIIHLANGWKVQRRKIAGGDYRMSLQGATNREELAGIEGASMEWSSGQFLSILAMPESQELRLRNWNSLTQYRPAVKVNRAGTELNIIDAEREKVLHEAAEVKDVDSYGFDNFIDWHQPCNPLLNEEETRELAEKAGLQLTATGDLFSAAPEPVVAPAVAVQAEPTTAVEFTPEPPLVAVAAPTPPFTAPVLPYVAPVEPREESVYGAAAAAVLAPESAAAPEVVAERPLSVFEKLQANLPADAVFYRAEAEEDTLATRLRQHEEVLRAQPVKLSKSTKKVAPVNQKQLSLF